MQCIADVSRGEWRAAVTRQYTKFTRAQVVTIIVARTGRLAMYCATRWWTQVRRPVIGYLWKSPELQQLVLLLQLLRGK